MVIVLDDLLAQAGTNARVYTLMSDVLQAVVDHYGNEGVALPDRRYVHVGAVAFDCEQLVFAADSLTPGLPQGASPPQKCIRPKSLQASLSLVRCVPGLTEAGDEPTVEALDEMAETLLVDAWLLPAAVIAAQAAGAFGDCSDVNIGVMDAVGPEGYFGGWRLHIGALLA
jgi:hypothetical protein